MTMPADSILVRRLNDEAAFVMAVFRRFGQDRILASAASLAYTSLLALVPLIAIAFSVLMAFPAFEGAADRLVEIVLAYVAPAVGEQVGVHIDRFVANTTRLTALGVVWLAVTAVMLLTTIENAFNVIWRVNTPRPLGLRLVAYWTTLTLGPLLLGAGLSLSTATFAAANLPAVGIDFGGVREVALRFVPFVLATTAFVLLYVALPHRRVRWRYALTGAVVAGALFEALKYGFGIYVRHAGTFESVYGSLAALPVFLIWMYLVWTVVLFGALVAATRPEFLAQRRSREFGPLTPARYLLRALQAIAAIRRGREEGRPVDDAALLEAVGGDGAALGHALAQLQRAGFVARTDTDAPVLIRDLGEVTVADIYDALGYAPGEIPDDSPRWTAALSAMLGDFRTARYDALAEPVPALLARMAQPDAPHLVSGAPDARSDDRRDA